MAKDYSPVGNTCPKIDEVISAVKSLEWGDDNYWAEEQVISIMEDIRKANHTLREWGNEKHKECDEKEDKINELESNIEDYEEQIKDLKSEEKELNTKIDSLEDEIYDLKNKIIELENN